MKRATSLQDSGPYGVAERKNGGTSPTATGAVNILLVDDEARNLDVLESILESPDYRLVRAQSAEEALLALLQWDFAAIILDIQMPVMSGIELAGLVKQRRRTADIPILFLTAYFHEDQDILHGYEAGAVDYLTKPVNSQILKSKVAVVVDLFRKTRALAAANTALEMEIGQRQQAEEALQLANSALEVKVFERTSDLDRANRELRASEERYRLILENALEYAICTLDPAGRVTSWNAGAQRVLGFEEQEMVGQRLEIIFTAQDRIERQFEAEMERGLAEGRAHDERWHVRKDGTLLWASGVIMSLKDGNGLHQGYLKILRDRTARKQAEDALRESEQRYRQLIRSLPAAVYTTDSEGRITLYNEAATALWGGEPQVGETMWCGSWRIYRPDGTRLQPQDYPPAATLRAGKAVQGEEIVIERPDGSRRHVLPYPQPILDFFGNAVGAVNMLVDITERKTAEDCIRRLNVELRRGLDEFQALINTAPVGIAVASDPECRHVWTNPGLAHMFGGDCGEEGPWVFSGEELPFKILRRGREIQASELPMQRACREGRQLLDEELDIVRRDGSVVHLIARATPLRDEADQIRGCVGVFLDITARKRAETAARDSEARFRNLADGAPVLIWIADATRACVWFNQRWLEFVGRPMEREVGEGWTENIHPEDRAHCLQSYDDSFGARAAFELEFRLRRHDEEFRWLLNHGIPMYDANGHFAGYVGSCIDITEQKRAQETLRDNEARLSAALRAKDDFFAALSHELRTPLNPVLLLASEAARNAELPEQVRADFDLIRKNVELEARLIDDLLDLTRITRGKLTLEPRAYGVHTILEDALANVRTELEKKRISLSLILTTDPADALVDNVRLQQIFWNVLTNAVKFTPEGGTVSVETSTGSGRLLVKVTDTGIGMTSEEIMRAFNAFAQGDHANNGSAHRFGGIGLGLTISRKLVELQGGSICASSSGRGHGTTILIELPLLPSAGPGVKLPTPASQTGLMTAKFIHTSCRLLLVEDHEPTRNTLAQLLRRRGFEVFTAGSLAEGRALAGQHQFDLLISDIGLPDGSGYELMMGLREQTTLKGIALTGFGMEEDIARSREAGFVAHLTKPVQIQSLDSVLMKIASARGGDLVKLHPENR